MEEITLRRNIQIRDGADLRVVHVHDSELWRAFFTTQSWVVRRPRWLVRKTIVGVGVRVEVGDEGDEPIFHVFGDGGVIDV